MGAPFRALVAGPLAAAFLDGPWTPSAMAERAEATLGGRTRWVLPLAHRMHAAFDDPPRDAPRALATAIAADRGFRRAMGKRQRLGLRRFFTPEPAMGRPSFEVQVPALSTTGDLAAWLGEEVTGLAWLADGRGLSRLPRDPRLGHYVRRWMAKRSGGARLVEAPKPRLKAIQRRLLREILDRVPPHDAAHGFRAGRDVVSHAAVHAGREAVLRMDLEDFFLSIPAPRVHAVFRALGYPEESSRVLAALCTSRAGATEPLAPPATAVEAAAQHRTRQRYRQRHLPQGAPTSPALANLCAYGLDVRLTAAAREAGATYTRYADDLVFSGGPAFARCAGRFATLVAVIAAEEGFRVQHRKTRLMRRSQRQRVTGLVINERPAIDRRSYDRLRAILHNCIQRGPASQNREDHADFRAHLEGLVSWVRHVQPGRGEELASLLGRVEWPA